jgi:hypothetical protein
MALIYVVGNTHPIGVTTATLNAQASGFTGVEYPIAIGFKWGTSPTGPYPNTDIHTVFPPWAGGSGMSWLRSVDSLVPGKTYYVMGILQTNLATYDCANSFPGTSPEGWTQLERPVKPHPSHPTHPSHGGV